MTRHYLENLFIPRSVAVVGASERPDSLGRYALNNLLSAGYAGELVAINPKYQRVAGLPCFGSLAAIGHPVDLALVATPARSVPALLDDAGRAGVRNAVVLSAGFGEMGEEGKVLEREVGMAARRNGVRMIGPNCLGILRPSIRLNASFARGNASPGSIALVSQSGAVATSLIDWAAAAGVGFSSVISMGAGIDLDFGEILDFLYCDAETRSILLYVEGVRDARRFISGLRSAARSKPIMVLKVGRHLSGSKAAMSHTGSLAGNDAVFDAVLRRCGVVRVKTYADLFSAAELIGNRPGAGRGSNRLAIVTNGGGPGVLAADFAVDAGVEMAALADATLARLDAVLPRHWSHGNPADVLGDADGPRLQKALETVLADEGVDAVLTLFCPQQVLPAMDAAMAIVAATQAADAAKPVLTAWLGEAEVRQGREYAERARLPAFQSPESAVAAFGALAEYRRAQRVLLEVPPPLTSRLPPDTDKAWSIAESAWAEGRTLLTEPESKRLLSCFGIPVPQTVIASSVEELKAAADGLGFPLAMKILSPDIAHKSDVGGVRLNIRDTESLVREHELLVAKVRKLRPEARIEGVAVQPMIEKRFGRELLVGVSTDPVFGRVISFGAGGVAVELLRDTAIGLPPLNHLLVRELVSRTRTAKLLAGYRHIPAANMDAIFDVLLRVSEMVCALPWIAEMDINPLVADESGCVALDARVVIDGARMKSDIRHGHLAIRPYPRELERIETIGGEPAPERVLIRPIRPEDAAIEAAFVEGLSDRSRHLRFFSQARSLSPAMLARFTQVDYERELALIVLPAEAPSPMIGVARYSPNPDGESCEFAVTVADAWHGRGVGTLLMSRLIEAAKAAGYRRMTGSVLAANGGMLQLARELGFTSTRSIESADVVETEKQLS
jgi:acetyltransferase